MPGATTRGYPYPLYGEATTFPAQIQALATAIDTDMDNLWDRVIAGGNQPAAVVETTGVNQAVANNTDVTATYATEVYDNANMANLGVSNTILSIVSTGVYLAMGRVSFAANAAAGERQITLLSSGALGVLARRTVSAGTVATSFSLSNVFFATSGTTVSMIQRQMSGVSINTDVRRLSVARLGGI